MSEKHNRIMYLKDQTINGREVTSVVIAEQKCGNNYEVIDFYTKPLGWKPKGKNWKIEYRKVNT
jgi:hypothetical protein